MGILHTVNKSPFERDSLQSCLKFARDGSTLLLYEDAVYGALSGTRVNGAVEEASRRLKVCVLGEDLRGRGFGAERLIPGVQVVDYPAFVDLVADSDKVQAWL
ncbi:tRNA 2-thiouridine synthesizing protein B [Gammaproteobacteria bacterium]